MGICAHKYDFLDFSIIGHIENNEILLKSKTNFNYCFFPFISSMTCQKALPLALLCCSLYDICSLL